MLLATTREKPRRDGEHRRVHRVVGACDGAGSERHRIGFLRRPAQPVVVAPQRRDMRQKEVRHEHGHRAPKMRVGRHDSRAGRFRLASRARRRPRRAAVCSTGNPPPEIEPQIQRDLLVARAARVQALAQVADALDELPLDERVHIFVGTVDERGLAPAPLENVRERRGQPSPLRAALNTPAPVSPSTHARLPVTSSSNRRLSKRKEDPNWKATGSGSLLNRPDQRFAIGYFASRADATARSAPFAARRRAFFAAVSTGSPQILMKPSAAE